MHPQARAGVDLDDGAGRLGVAGPVVGPVVVGPVVVGPLVAGTVVAGTVVAGTVVAGTATGPVTSRTIRDFPCEIWP